MYIIGRGSMVSEIKMKNIQIYATGKFQYMVSKSSNIFGDRGESKRKHN